MELAETLKHLLQVCADIQDGLWMAAAHAGKEELPGLFQDAAVQWKTFADQIFAVLLGVNHTSPEARWKANPDRAWMNHHQDPASMGDRRLCQECIAGLNAAQNELQKALATTGHPRVRALLEDQLGAAANQAALLQAQVENGLGSSIPRQRADSPGGDPSIN